MVAGVHAVEAYLLYPQIYAYRLKLHPLIVMVSTVRSVSVSTIFSLCKY